MSEDLKMRLMNKMSGIPCHSRAALARYIVERRIPGGFLRAVICNDLRAAVERADDANVVAIPAYVRFLYNYAPSSCWGSKERYEAWLDGDAPYMAPYREVV